MMSSGCEHAVRFVAHTDDFISEDWWYFLFLFFFCVIPFMTLAHNKRLSKFFLFMPSNVAHRFKNRNPNDSTIKHNFYSSYDNKIMRKQRANTHTRDIHTAKKKKWTGKKRRNEIYRLKRHKWYKLTKRTHNEQIKIDNNNNYPQKKRIYFPCITESFHILVIIIIWRH